METVDSEWELVNCFFFFFLKEQTLSSLQKHISDGSYIVTLTYLSITVEDTIYIMLGWIAEPSIQTTGGILLLYVAVCNIPLEWKPEIKNKRNEHPARGSCHWIYQKSHPMMKRKYFFVFCC